MTFLNHIHRLLRRRGPQPPPKLDYLPESTLPVDAAELVRLKIIRPWRLEHHTQEQWYTADIGAIEWFVENLGGPRDA